MDLVLVATFLDTTVDWVKQTAVTTNPSAMAALSRKLADALAKAAPEEVGYCSTFASTVVDRFSLLFAADAGANLLFNTSGTYGNIKTAEFCYRCAQQLDQIGDAAHSHLGNASPAANSLTTWAMADYFREISVSAYHQDYADLLQGGRVATWIANLVTSGGTDANIDQHNGAARVVGDGADQWVHPVAMNQLLKLYRPANTIQATSGPPSASIPVLLIGHGFGFADHSDLTTNGSTAFRASQLVANRISAVLTDGSVQAGSVFTRRAVNITHFKTQFVFRLSGGPVAALMTRHILIISLPPATLTIIPFRHISSARASRFPLPSREQPGAGKSFPAFRLPKRYIFVEYENMFAHRDAFCMRSDT